MNEAFKRKPPGLARYRSGFSRKQHRESRRRLRRPAFAHFSFIFLVLGSCASLNLWAKDSNSLTAFYIVSAVTSDASPFWYHYILDVEADGNDSVVRYIRVAPLDSMCAEAITVDAAITRLRGLPPSDLVPQGNLCAIDAASVNRDLRRQTRRTAIFDSVRYGIVATCGSRTVQLHLPFPEQVRLDRLRKMAPQLAQWWDLEQSVSERVFGKGQSFYDVTAAQGKQLQDQGYAILPELLSGRFDAGLPAECLPHQACKTQSFRDELQGYVGPVGAREAPRLAQADEYRFSRYVAPKYPHIAVMARISGTVKLELSVDPNSGEVRGVSVVSGHPLLRSATIDAAKQWRFIPEDVPRNGEHVPADLVFDWVCPKPISK